MYCPDVCKINSYIHKYFTHIYSRRGGGQYSYRKRLKMTAVMADNHQKFFLLQVTAITHSTGEGLKRTIYLSIYW
jgi:hypothetical protein